VLSWSASLTIIFIREDGNGTVNTVAAGSITLGNNEAVYADLNETNNTVITLAKAAIGTGGSASGYKAFNRVVLGMRNTTTGKFYPVVPMAIFEGSVTPAEMKTKAIVALADTAVTLTAAQLIDSGIFTAVPTTARAQQLPTAANIIAQLPGYQTGTEFDFLLVNTAAFDETMTTNTGLTLIGNMVVNNASGNFKGLVTSGTTVTILRA
jgi:hypothetical protein